MEIMSSIGLTLVLAPIWILLVSCVIFYLMLKIWKLENKLQKLEEEK